MTGLYLHIPFCKQSCHYCNFHFSTSQNNREEVLNAINKEINQKADHILDSKTMTTNEGSQYQDFNS